MVDAGQVTPYEYAIALAENAADNGVEFQIRSCVKVNRLQELYQVVRYFGPYACLHISHPQCADTSAPGN